MDITHDIKHTTYNPCGLVDCMQRCNVRRCDDATRGDSTMRDATPWSDATRSMDATGGSLMRYLSSDIRCACPLSERLMLSILWSQVVRHMHEVLHEQIDLGPSSHTSCTSTTCSASDSLSIRSVTGASGSPNLRIWKGA
jgi:hypothetical protein